ncbi:hypothetical protein HT136_01500 [Novosphingobium profundi]|uniref:hypothetical protein n=1 Tax=Novosphingobium profundi TaxID=1774954 RepID=UPI001BDB4EFA|nr:hypothetical protein [Novosphingobium profundi]MBT0667042.1 hypothetical protein [Novosphingobium profundi]
MTTPRCPICQDSGFKDHSGFAMDPCDHQVQPPQPLPILLQPATDWTGQTIEQRLEECAAALTIHGLLSQAAHQRTLDCIRARGNFQREQHATLAERTTNDG